MKYFPERQVLKQYLHRKSSAGQRVEEAGRLTLVPAVRSITTSRQMVAASFAVQMLSGVDETIVTCIPRHRAFYSQFGFERLEGTQDHFCPETGATFSCLHTSNSNPPQGLRKELENMVAEFMRSGRICIRPSQPGVYCSSPGSDERGGVNGVKEG